MYSFISALLLSHALAQPPTCDMCWDGTVPKFNGQSCEPCPLQEATQPTSTECDAEIKAFCDQVSGTFDTSACACYIEYLPSEDEWTGDFSENTNEDETTTDDTTTPTESDNTTPTEDETADPTTPEEDNTGEPDDFRPEGLPDDEPSGPPIDEDGNLPWEDAEDIEVIEDPKEEWKSFEAERKHYN